MKLTIAYIVVVFIGIYIGALGADFVNAQSKLAEQPGQIITYCELKKLGDDNYLVEVYTRRGAYVLKMNRKELSKLHRVMY